MNHNHLLVIQLDISNRLYGKSSIKSIKEFLSNTFCEEDDYSKYGMLISWAGPWYSKSSLWKTFHNIYKWSLLKWSNEEDYSKDRMSIFLAVHWYSKYSLWKIFHSIYKWILLKWSNKDDYSKDRMSISWAVHSSEEDIVRSEAIPLAKAIVGRSSMFTSEAAWSHATSKETFEPCRAEGWTKVKARHVWGPYSGPLSLQC